MANSIKSLKGEELPPVKLACQMIDKIYDMRRTNEITADIYGVDPIGLDLDPHNLEYKTIIFESITAKAREFDLAYVSFGEQDFVTPRIKNASVFDDMGAWRIVRELALPGSCGNGMGEAGAQYQLNCPRYLGQRKGIYDPWTEQLLCDLPFRLGTSRTIMNKYFTNVTRKSIKGRLAKSLEERKADAQLILERNAKHGRKY